MWSKFWYLSDFLNFSLNINPNVQSLNLEFNFSDLLVRLYARKYNLHQINESIGIIAYVTHYKKMKKHENIKQKSILKSESTVESATTSTCKKCTTFDEDNIIKTLHPKEKNYGNQIITEPKTPYEWRIDDKCKPVDPHILHAKLVDLEKQQLLEQKSSLSFDAKRKKHYDEYRNVEMAKLLLSKEEHDSETDADATVEDQTQKWATLCIRLICYINYLPFYWLDIQDMCAKI